MSQILTYLAHIFTEQANQATPETCINCCAQVTEPASAGAQVGSGVGVALYAVVRVSFLLSIISIFPMQMWPLRQALCKLAFGRELHGAPKEPDASSRFCKAHALGRVGPLQLCPGLQGGASTL